MRSAVESTASNVMGVLRPDEIMLRKGVRPIPPAMKVMDVLISVGRVKMPCGP